MDNFKIDIVSIGTNNLNRAMELAFTNSPGAKAEGYCEHPEKGLIFFWSLNLSSPDGTKAFLMKLDAEGGAFFAERWLAEQPYGREPDHDGDNKKGFRIYNESWGRIGNWSGSFIAIKPEWAMYGK